MGRLRNISRLRAGGTFPATSNTVDLFIVAGQSNAVGEGDSSQSPIAPAGLYIQGSTITAPLIDPMGNVNTGSAWTSFSNEWAKWTHRKSAFVYQAVVGSSLVVAGAGWNPTGPYRAQAVSAAQSAITAINGSTYTLGSVYFLWLQGEQEAQTYDGTTITPATYATALQGLADYFKAQIPSMVKMGVIHICGTGNGSLVNSQDALHTNYELIRSGITTGVNADANMVMLYDGSHHGVAIGGLKDGTHYNQFLYNKVGRMAARQLASPRVVPQPGLAGPLATTNFNDTIAAKSTRTVSLSTNASTTCLAVCVSSSFPATNVPPGVSCTFNGIAMKAAAFTTVGSASPAGNATAAIFVLDNTYYGGSLAGVTGNIVVTQANPSKFIDISAIELTGVGLYVDTEGGDYAAAASPGTTATSVVLPAIYYQSYVIFCSAALAASAAGLTWSGTNLTKVMDHGVSDGTNSCQTAVGYLIENSPSVANRTYTATYSGNCTHRATVAIALRSGLDGEQ